MFWLRTEGILLVCAGVMYFDFWVSNVKHLIQPLVWLLFFLFSLLIRNRPNWGRRDGPWLSPVGTEEPKWDRLAEKLYNVCCFMKSQEKRDPEECDDLLYELWWAWKGAFPDMSFNKFHGLFCGNRNFVHKYKAIGIFSEESCEAYMSVLEKGKKG